MSEMTHTEALRQALALVSQGVKEAEARCAVLAQYINDCDTSGSRTGAWSVALRELRALHDYRSGLMRRQSLIQQALDCPVRERPDKVPLSTQPGRPAPRTQRQVQIQARRQRS